MIDKVTLPGPIEVDQLRGTDAPAQVLLFDPSKPFAAGPTRDPHRHDYHELFLVRDGVTRHLVDAQEVVVGAGEVMLIGRGQVHTLVEATDVRGAVVRFRDELLVGAARETFPAWLLATCGSEVLQPPTRELEHAISALELLDDELRRPADAGTDGIVANLLGVVLALVQRWQDASTRDTGTSPATSSPDMELLRRFLRLLEAEHARHHDAAWYAGELAISPNHLASILTRLTGRSTKRLVTDRVMTEVSRLLRFTDLNVQQVALRTGYDDPLYLSRAFKAHTGLSPSAWRERGTA
jgi:AraC-like DNA-binding protein